MFGSATNATATSVWIGRGTATKGHPQLRGNTSAAKALLQGAIELAAVALATLVPSQYLWDVWQMYDQNCNPLGFLALI